jgi:hypothetical protein
MLKNKDCGWGVSIPEGVGEDKWSGDTTIAVYKHSLMNHYMYCYRCWNFWTWEIISLTTSVSGLLEYQLLYEDFCLNIIIKSSWEWNSPEWKMVKLIQAMYFYGEKYEISFLLSPLHWQHLLCACIYIVGNVDLSLPSNPHSWLLKTEYCATITAHLLCNKFKLMAKPNS